MKAERAQRDLVAAQAAPEQLQRRARGDARAAVAMISSTPVSSACSRSLAPAPVLMAEPSRVLLR